MKKHIALLLALLVLICTAAGCGKKSAPVRKELDSVKERGTLRIGIMVCPPFTYHIDGEWTGFDISLARDVCARIGVEPEFIEIDWKNKYIALEQEQVDCLWSGISVDDELRERISFSQAYLAGRLTPLSLKDTQECRRVAVEQNSASYAAAMNFLPDAEILPVASCVEAVEKILSGEADGAIVNLIYANALVNGELRVWSDSNLGTEELAVVFRKDSDIAAAVNKALTELERSGALNNLAERYAVSDSLIVG